MERRKNLYSQIWKRELDYISTMISSGVQSGKPLTPKQFKEAAKESNMVLGF